MTRESDLSFRRCPNTGLAGRGPKRGTGVCAEGVIGRAGPARQLHGGGARCLHRLQPARRDLPLDLPLAGQPRPDPNRHLQWAQRGHDSRGVPRQRAGLAPVARQRLSLRRVATLARRNPDWRWVTRARLADGFTGSLVGLVLTILMFLVLKNEQQVGNFNGLMGLLGVGISLALATFMRPQHRIACALVGGALLVLSTFLLPLYLTAWAIVGFGLLRAVGGPLHGNALAPLALQVIDRDPTPQAMRYDYIVHQELCLGIGRVLSIGCFLLLAAPMNQLLLARIVVLVAGASPILIGAAFPRIPQVPSIADADNRALPAVA